MRIIFLGTGAAIPTNDRGLACMCVERDGHIMMFDAGEGAQMAFAKVGLGWNKHMSIFISHMHGDHCLGLLGMIQTMSMRGRQRPLHVWGPVGLGAFVQSNMDMLGFRPPFEVKVSDIPDADNGILLDTDTYTIQYCKAEHTTDAYSYRIQEKPRPGHFDSEQARELGIPEGELWGRLQGGRTVEVGGRIVYPKQVLGKSRSGLSVGYSGDTRPTGRLEKFFAGCDYLVFDSTFTEEEAEKALATGHSTAAEAARLARGGDVRHLVLTHFSARYESDAVSVAEAMAIHPKVTAAKDLMVIDV